MPNRFWNYNRTAFFGQFAVLSGAAVAAVLAQCLVFKYGTGWVILTGASPQRIAALWNDTRQALSSTGILVAPLVALWLGTQLAASARRTPDPAARWWLAGILQLASALVSAYLLAFTLLAVLTGTIGRWLILELIPLALAASAVTYGLGYCVALEMEDRRKALGVSLAVLVGYVLVVVGANQVFAVRLPFIWNLLITPPHHNSPDVVNGSREFPLLRLVGCLLAALAFFIAARGRRGGTHVLP